MFFDEWEAALTQRTFAWDIQGGAQMLPDGTTRFRVWAPSQNRVSLAVDSGALLPMTQVGGGWFQVITPFSAGTEYRYQLGNGLLVPDPASRAQAGDLHDFSVVIDPSAYIWQHASWLGRPWHEAVVYELHVGLCGGFRGVIERLDSLVALGITAISLMPVNDFPGKRNWGYDGVLPYAPDAAYGSPDDLKALVDAAHARNLMIFLDVVYNHFGPDGNYLSEYAPGFFRDDQPTPWGRAIDFRQREVRSFFLQNVLMWLMEYRFDGLRFDAAHAIGEQDWLVEMAATVRTTIEPDRQVHLILEHHNAGNLLRGQIDAQWNDDAHNVLHVLLTGEDGGYYADYAKQPAEQLARCLLEGWAYQGEMSDYLGHPRGEPATDLSPMAHVLFLQNHDQIGNRAFGERLTVLAPPAALRAAIVLQMLCPQIPMLFMGEEVASRAPFLFFTDHNPDLAEAVRAGRRKEFARFADFASGNELPDPNDPDTFARCRPVADSEEAEVRQALYRHLITIRQTEIIPRLPGAQGESATVLGGKSVHVVWRMGDGCRLHLAINLDDRGVPFHQPNGRLLFGETPLDGLPAHQTVCVLESQR